MRRCALADPTTDGHLSKILYSGKLKRWFGLAFSLLSLPVVIQLGLIAAAIIKLDSPGAILI
jgi:lipopolysaccharide/colanic/teichoic acid biosynthesis glycosyltransferase